MNRALPIHKPFGKARTILMVLVAVAVARPQSARGFVAGGGKAANDCLIGYHGIADDDVTFDGTKRLVECTDCDPTCDLDGTRAADEQCTFRIGVCINQTGVDGCSPPVELTKASAHARIPKRAKRTIIAVPSPLQGPMCGGLQNLVVPLEAAGKKDGKGVVFLSASIKKNKAEGVLRRFDNDKITLVCRRRDGACPGSTPPCVPSSGTFCDLGNGTVFDLATNLQWEKKTTQTESGPNAADLHDVDNTYVWAGVCSNTYATYCQPNAAAEALCRAQTVPASWSSGCAQCSAADGTCSIGAPGITTVWDWLDQLRTAGFAGHDDWRLASGQQLDTILVDACEVAPCISAVFGPTVSNSYWSSSTSDELPGNAAVVDFYTGATSVIAKDYDAWVRAVRDGS